MGGEGESKKGGKGGQVEKPKTQKRDSTDSGVEEVEAAMRLWLRGWINRARALLARTNNRKERRV